MDSDMNIIQCSLCKKPFQSIGRRICPVCLEKTDKDFITVRDYIYDHKHANLDTVAEETGVSKQIIMHLLREGRLILDTPDGDGVLTCEACKKPINTGKLCKECAEKVSSRIQGNIDKRPGSGGKGDPPLRGTAKLQS